MAKPGRRNPAGSIAPATDPPNYQETLLNSVRRHGRRTGLGDVLPRFDPTSQGFPSRVILYEQLERDKGIGARKGPRSGPIAHGNVARNIAAKMTGGRQTSYTRKDRL